MTSVEIAELTGKKHIHVMRDIRRLIEPIRIETIRDSGRIQSFVQVSRGGDNKGIAWRGWRDNGGKEPIIVSGGGSFAAAARNIVVESSKSHRSERKNC
jgi:hypothetical protein